MLLGTRPFEAALEEKIHLARYFHDQMQSIDGFEVGPPPDLSIVTFHYLPKSGDVDEFNRRLLDSIGGDGRILFNQFGWQICVQVGRPRIKDSPGNH
jgi:glutamate/tyrosine decarboxylase-like PLP-dependent enzyme